MSRPSDDASKQGPGETSEALKPEASTPRRKAKGKKKPTEDAVLDALCSLAPALSLFYGRNCEVVVHDLREPERSIVAIENSHVTGRKLHGPLVGGPFGDVSLKWLREKDAANRTQVYETKTRDGRTLKSSTTLFRNSREEPFAALCLNHDIHVAETALSFLSEVVNTATSATSRVDEEPSDPPDVDDILAQMVEDVLNSHRSPPLTKEERTSLVRDLDDKGAFLVRGAVQRVAKALGVSKFTIYGDLERVRSN